MNVEPETLKGLTQVSRLQFQTDGCSYSARKAYIWHKQRAERVKGRNEFIDQRHRNSLSHRSTALGTDNYQLVPGNEKYRHTKSILGSTGQAK